MFSTLPQTEENLLAKLDDLDEMLLSGDDDVALLNAVQVDENVLEDSKDKDNVRKWDSWSLQEEHSFYAGIKLWKGKQYNCNQRFEYLSKKIPEKSAEQIRQYYYRIIKRINGIFQQNSTRLLNMNDIDEIRIGLLCWYRCCMNLSSKKSLKTNAVRLENLYVRKRFVKEFLQSFNKNNKLMMKARQKGFEKKKRSSSVMETSLDVYDAASMVTPTKNLFPSKNNQKASPASTPVGRNKMKIIFLPMDKTSKRRVADAGLLSRFHLQISMNAKVADAWKHMMKKWERVVADFNGNGRLRFMPLGNRTHPGWGGDDISVSMKDIAAQIATPEDQKRRILTLEYKWDVDPTPSEYPRSNDLLQPPDGLLSTIPESTNDIDVFGTDTIFNDFLNLPKDDDKKTTITHVKKRRRITPTLVPK